MDVKQLLDRYQLKTRQSLYNRLNQLNISLEKDFEGKGYATESQIKLLDQLQEWLNHGGTIKTFAPTVNVEIDSQDSKNIPKKSQNNSQLSISEKTPQQLELFDVLSAIALGNRSPINHWKELIYAVDNELILSTLEVKELLGVAPKGKEYIRGSFKLVKQGKIGNQSGWKVEKV